MLGRERMNHFATFEDGSKREIEAIPVIEREKYQRRLEESVRLVGLESEKSVICPQPVILARIASFLATH